MATYTENYNLKKPTYAEPANVKDINDNMEIIDDVMHNTQISLADAYDQNETYNTGDIVMYEMLMYKCKEDNVTGAWNASKWKRTTAGESGGGADLDIYGEASGTAEASFSDGAEASLVECEIGIVPTQDLHGYSKPWAGGAGKNKLPLTVESIKTASDKSTWNNNSITINGITYEIQVDTDGNVLGIKTNGTASGDSNLRIYDGNAEFHGEILNGCPSNGSINTYYMQLSNVSVGIDYDLGNGTIISQTDTGRWILIINIKSGTTVSNLEFKPMIRLSSVADDTFEPYSNICPISGHTDVTVTVASTSGGSGEDTTVSLGRTVYGGTLDVTTGVLTVDKASSDLGDLSWVKSAEGRFQSTSLNGTIAVNTAAEKPNMICSAYEVYRVGAGSSLGITAFTEGGTSYIRCIDSNYASDTDFTNGVSGQTIVYKLATPQTFNLTPTQVLTLLGQNYVSHDGGGTISLVYVKGDAPIKPNPADAEIPLTGLEIDGEKFKIAGKEYSETSLYTYTGSTRQTTLELSDDFTEYDAIEFTFGWNLGGDDFETVNVVPSSKIASGIFVNVGGEGRYNYISKGTSNSEIILATAQGSWDGSSIIREVRGIKY